MTARRRRPPAIGSPEWFAPAAIRARGRSAITRMLQLRCRQYAATKNPVYVWSALAIALDGRRRVPDWITEYLRRVATALDTLSRRRIPRKHALPRAVYRALEFGTPGAVVNPFADQADYWHRLNIAIEVNAQLGAPSKLDAAWHHVVQTHHHFCTRRPPCRRISRSTVIRAWQAFKGLVATDPNV